MCPVGTDSVPEGGASVPRRGGGGRKTVPYHACLADLPQRPPDAVRNRWHRLQKMYNLSDSQEGREALDLHLLSHGIDSDWTPCTPEEKIVHCVRGSDHGRSMWSAREDQIIADGVRRYGGKWRLIAQSLPGRSDSSVRNRWVRIRKEFENADSMQVKTDLLPELGTDEVDSNPPQVQAEGRIIDRQVGAPAYELAKFIWEQSEVRHNKKAKHIDHDYSIPHSEATGPTCAIQPSLPPSTQMDSSPKVSVAPYHPDLKRRASSTVNFKGHEIEQLVDVINGAMGEDDEIVPTPAFERTPTADGLVDDLYDMAEALYPEMKAARLNLDDTVLRFDVDEFSSLPLRKASGCLSGRSLSSGRSSSIETSSNRQEKPSKSNRRSSGWLPDTIDPLVAGMATLGLVSVAAIRLLHHTRSS